ncbi:ATP-binding protein [Rugamonas sp. CCM 8940]|uniref:BbrUII/HgiDII family restriction enzyme n=1 Tax=Rugamonas sp. CCM 8940 TaxID=2765359 RepID=UPI0018F2ECDF|nr:ATP-binding protein [Rugamonas sp. CCM 8940]
MAELKFRIELNVLNHLGIGLYSSTPAVVTEIISNAWDADAKEVKIKLEPDNDIIEVEDDGHGMSEADVINKFLKVGYSRRTREPNGPMSRSNNRRVMGRKGIGKLAMFSLANTIQVVTKAADSPAVAFKIDVARLKALASGTEEVLDYPVETIAVPADFLYAHGTRITLTQLNSRINKTEAFLRPRLVRRFGVFDDQFKVHLNGTVIVRGDANFYPDVQFLWYFDTTMKDIVSALATNIAEGPGPDGKPAKYMQPITSLIPSDIPDLTLRGFIATVDTPSKLGRGDESLNRISIFANGRLFQEDILAELGDARYFNSYIVGEVYADFLDNDGIDRATASRESIKHDDERFQALRVHLSNSLRQIRDQWDEWRRALGYVKTDSPNPAVIAWIDSFRDPRDRSAANRIMTSIGNLVVSNDDTKNAEAKKMLYKSAIVGFEKLRSRHQLDALEKITDVLSPEFQAIFSSLDDIEESYYLDITRQRLEIIRKFSEEIVDEGKLEKVAHRYLFDHLWLLDPSWDRVSGSEEMERTMTTELKKACPDTLVGARLDIAYRTTSGRHVIIELKRPGLTVRADELETQGRKYVEAMEQFYRDHPDFMKYGGRVPPIDVFFLISTNPPMSERQLQAFALYNMKVLTYKGLIDSARATYQNYFDVKAQVGKIEAVLSAI